MSEKDRKNWVLKMGKEIKYGKLNWKINDKNKYLAFENSEEADLWGLKYYKKWAEYYKKSSLKLSNVLKGGLCSDPVGCYCGYSYREINGFMRYGDDNNCCTYRELSNILLITLFHAPRIPENVILYRMVSDGFINELIEKNRQEEPTPIQEKGFMSTSLVKDIANQNEPYAIEKNMLKIFVPKDTIGIYVDVVARRNEREILIFPNMFLGLISYPYKDKKTNKIIYECCLININTGLLT